MMKLIACALLLGIAVSMVTVRGHKCCGSIQFMAGQRVTVGEVDESGATEGFYTYQYGAYDFYNRMYGFKFDLFYPNGTKQIGYRIIMNYWESVQWVIIDEEKYCEKSETTFLEPFNCIPDNATFQTTYSIGGTDVWVDVWAFPVSYPKDPIQGDFAVSVTANTCDQIEASFIGSRYDSKHSKQLPFVTSSLLYNVTQGIPDRDTWFKPPSFCKQDNSISSTRSHASRHLDLLNIPMFL